MKEYLFSSLIILLILSYQAIAEEVPHPEIQRISAYSAYEKFKSGKALFVDTMDPVVYAKNHIVGAVNLPGEGPEAVTRKEVIKLPIPFDREIILYCM